MFERAANAFDGELDIAPRAIADDLTKLHVKRWKQNKVEVEFQERPSGSDDDDKQQFDEPLDPGPGPDSQAPAREMITRVLADLGFKQQMANPKCRMYLLARLRGANQLEASRQAKVTDRTARNYEARLRPLFSSGSQ